MAKGKDSLTMLSVIVVIAVFAVSLVAVKGGGNPFSLSYGSGYEGPKAQFLGVTYNNMIYTGTNTHGASLCQFDNFLHFDPDGASSGKPKIQGEMTAIFIPKESLTSIPAWIPIKWLQNNGLVSNPVTGDNGANPPYSWDIDNKTYLMEEYSMRFYMAFSAEWSGSEMPVMSQAEALVGGVKANVYQNTGIWIKFDISPTAYIDGTTPAYFAIAQIRLSEDAIMKGKDANGQTYDARTTKSVTPESQGSLVSLYYGQFGAQGSPSESPYQYEGKNLNPAYFTNALYMHVDLNNFGVSTQPVNYFGRLEKGDTVTFAFEVRVFVIGEYKVKDTQPLPDQYGRFTQTQTTGVNWLTGIIGWLSSPANVSLLVIIIIIAAIVIFAPWLLIVIISVFSGKH